MKKKQLYKIIMLGDSYVGKTALMAQATIGADFLSKEVSSQDTFCTLQLWDTAGQERFQSLGVAFYRGADCCILVYDITNVKSFENLSWWKEQFLDQGGYNQNQIPFIVIGNKLDQKERLITEEEAKKWCINQGQNFSYFECSAQEYLSVKPIFDQIPIIISKQGQPKILIDINKDLISQKEQFQKDVKHLNENRMTAKIIQNCC